MRSFFFTRKTPQVASPRHLAQCLAIAACFGLAATAHAQTAAVASGNWNAAETWSNGVPVSTAPTVIGGGHTVTLDRAGESRQIHIANGRGETGTLNVSGATLTISGGRTLVGDGGGTGILNITQGSTVTLADNFSIAANAASTGTLNVSGASTFTVSAQFQAERKGDATINISEGSRISANHIWIGNGIKLNLIGSGSTLAASGNINPNNATTGAVIHFALDAAGASKVTAAGMQGIDLREATLKFSTLPDFKDTAPTPILLFEATHLGHNATISNFNADKVDWGSLDRSKWTLQLSHDGKQLSLQRLP